MLQRKYRLVIRPLMYENKQVEVFFKNLLIYLSHLWRHRNFIFYASFFLRVEILKESYPIVEQWFSNNEWLLDTYWSSIQFGVMKEYGLKFALNTHQPSLYIECQKSQKFAKQG